MDEENEDEEEGRIRGKQSEGVRNNVVKVYHICGKASIRSGGNLINSARVKLPCSAVNCFSGRPSIVAWKSMGSDRPLALNAYIDRVYMSPGWRPPTVNRGIVDVKFAFSSCNLEFAKFVLGLAQDNNAAVLCSCCDWGLKTPA